MKKQIDSFTVTHSVELKEINSTLVELIHEPSGAQIMQIANEDEENLFNLSFRTWPEKSDGVAHILEHTVLCGSEKYPVRDPFFSMNRRSLNTFMNALTGADFTCYPAASQVEKDFYNLLEVYLDAVFHPKLAYLSFLQEGHRLEFMNPKDPNTPLLFKGIVFNEMKGAMATGDARLGEELMHTLFPNLTYGVNSGGDPKEIPDLTYEELKAFHAKFYHPSRCLFYFYGNLPLEKHLSFLHEHVLKGVEKLPPLPPLPTQPRFTKPVAVVKSYPISEEEATENKTLFGLSWLTCSILNQEELLALDVLDLVLMGTDAAPLKQALLKSNLCKQTDSMIDNEISEIPFSIVCKGCPEKSAESLETCIITALEKLVEEGIAQNLIEGAIHQFELARTEITGNSTPYGLSLFFRSALLKQHGGRAEDGLRVHTLFEKLRKKTQDPTYLTGLIRKYLLDNPHRVRVVLHPDKGVVKKEIEEEQKKLLSLCETFEDRDVLSLIKQAEELQSLQESNGEQNLDVLPKVGLEDVKQKGKEFGLQQGLCGPYKLFYHPCFTNEILYADLLFDLPDIEEEDLPYLRLFTLLLPQMGCGGRTYQENLEYILEHTGGVSLSLDPALQADDPNKMRPSLSLRGKALYRKRERFFSLFYDMLTSVNFDDPPRLKELLMQHLNSLENAIQQNSLRYAVSLAARGFSIPSKIANDWYGLDYYHALKQIAATFAQNSRPLIEKLRTFQTLCLGLEGGELVLSCDEKMAQTLQKEGFFALSQMPAKSSKSWRGDYALPDSESQGRVTASPVAFTALLFSSLPYTHPAAAALSIASELMENKTLHKRIREQGGAYGSGAVNSLLSGQFYFYAYRDPHVVRTLEAFREAVDAIAKGAFESQDLEEAKLGLFQDLDSPIPPGGRAIAAYSRLRGGRTAERRQTFREQLLNCTKEEITQAAERYLLPGLDKSVTVTFAGKELLEKENTLLKDPLPIYPV